MASSDNLMHPYTHTWNHLSAFSSDPWNVSDLFTKESDAFARALQSTFSELEETHNNNSNNNFPMMHAAGGGGFVSGSSFVDEYVGGGVSLSTPTISGGSENNDTSASVSVTKQQRRAGGGVATGRVGKQQRKSRSMKKAMTKVYTADPASFRQMVQQVTGINAVMRKPEDKGSVLLNNELAHNSSFFLDTSVSSAFLGVEEQLGAHIPATVLNGNGGGALDFDSFCFPTLESWEAM